LSLQEISALGWIGLLVGAMGIGVSKSGFPGISMLHVVVFAIVFGALDSTGVLLPLLVVGDLCAIRLFGRKADWHHVRRLLPPTLVGVVAGWALMDRVDENSFKLLVGTIILALSAVQGVRMWKPDWFGQVPHQRWFALLLGGLAGLTTMLANAAGPVVGLYLLAVCLPKWELIGTSAWLFLVLNLVKLPLSYDLGLIDGRSLAVDAVLAAAVPVGMLMGRWLVHRVSQSWFNTILLGFTVVGAIRLMV